MGVEIERKFLLKNSNWKNHIEKETSIKQGYLNSDKNRTVRVRTVNEKAFLTIKGKTQNNTRQEFEYEIPHNDAIDLLKLCETPIIEKTRFIVVHKDSTWEIDVFHGENEGLILAEIELNNANEEFELPEWIGQEVSSDNKYYNSSLIINPYKNW